VIGNTLLTPAIASLAASTLLTAFSGPQQHENRQEQKNKKESDGGGHGSKGGWKLSPPNKRTIEQRRGINPPL
jgi:hypothetical protein